MFTGQLPPVSNKATWVGSFELRDADTDDLIDISNASQITVEVRDPQSRSAVLSGSLTGGEVTRPDTGIFDWTFSATQMRALCAKTYEVGATLTQNGETVQLIIGTLPVIDGIVS